MFQIGAKIIKQPLYFGQSVNRLYLSKNACIATSILSPNFPQPMNSVAENLLNINPTVNSANLENSDNIKAGRIPPQYPTSIPFNPTVENVPKLNAYIEKSFRDSALDRSAPFPTMQTVAAHIHLKKDAIPMHDIARFRYLSIGRT